MTSTTSAMLALPAYGQARWPLRRVIAVALATFASVFALTIGLMTLWSGTPASCGADCATVLSQHRFAVVLGVPAIAWAAALHLVLAAVTWALVLGPTRLSMASYAREGEPAPLRPERAARSVGALLQAAQLGLVVALLGGSATYLVLGLATGVRCNVCLTMHACALVAALGSALHPRVEGNAPIVQRAAAIALACAAWVGLAWGITQVSARARTAREAPAASTQKWLAAVCEPGSCPAAARFGPEALPADDGSLVLGDGPGPTLVAWLDLDCAACRADFKAEEPLLRARVRGGRGLRLMLRANARACDASARGGDARACEAPAMIVCAARHGGPDAALDLLAWELSATPGYHTLPDRRAALGALGPMAARCLDAELALGARGTLAAHAEAARRMAAQARDHAGCDRAADAPWWCFSATPSFAIVQPTRLAASAGTSSEAFGSATGELRTEVLEQCLEVP